MAVAGKLDANLKKLYGANPLQQHSAQPWCCLVRIAAAWALLSCRPHCRAALHCASGRLDHAVDCAALWTALRCGLRFAFVRAM